MAGRGEGIRVRRDEGSSEPARPVRRPPQLYRAFFEPGGYGGLKVPRLLRCTASRQLRPDFGVDAPRPERLHPRRQRVPHLLHQRRGDEQMGSTWNYLDITALGRQESGRTRRGLPADLAVQVVERTTTTTPRPRLTRNGSTLEKPPSESATSATRTTSTPPTADRGAPPRRAGPGDRSRRNMRAP